MEGVFNGSFVPSELRKHLEAVIGMADEEGEKESFCEGGEEKAVDFQGSWTESWIVVQFTMAINKRHQYKSLSLGKP